MKEQLIQTKIIKYLEKKWYIVINIIKTNKNWLPDLLVLIWKWKHFWIEVKQETWILSKIQEYRIKTLRENWDLVWIPYGFQDFIKQFEIIEKSL